MPNRNVTKMIESKLYIGRESTSGMESNTEEKNRKMNRICPPLSLEGRGVDSGKRRGKRRRRKQWKGRRKMRKRRKRKIEGGR